MNQVLSLPGQPNMQVEVILASKSTVEQAPPIVTMRMRYPRIIHAEVKTHRVMSSDSIEVISSPSVMDFKEFSRNARSSRAVPVKRMIEEIQTDPFVPWHWGKNQKGMQAGEECDAPVLLGPHKTDDAWQREDAWQSAKNIAVNHAQAFMDAGYHKQIANRLLEPFMWIDTLVTSTDWANFLWLRDHKDAEPHLQDLARLVKQALDEAEYQTLQPGDWHLPYVRDADWSYASSGDTSQHATDDSPLGAIAFLKKVSATRCARISYAPFDGDASYERELERYESLLSSDRIHASPLEHQATPDSGDEDLDDAGYGFWTNPELHGNFTGWIQFRKLIPGEHHTE